MLRITRLSQKGQGLTIKLEGEIVGAWVDAARDACAIRGRRPQRRLRLDLAAVTYVDAAGIQLLRNLIAEGYRPYVPTPTTTLSGLGRLGRVGFVHWEKTL